MQPSGTRNSMTPSPRNYPITNAGGIGQLHKSTFDADEQSYEPLPNAGEPRLNIDSLAFLNEMSEQLASNKATAPTNSYQRDANDSANYLPTRNDEKVCK